jgi:XapX domain-containing protein
MKVLFLSFVVGLGVGVLYGLIRVKSPALPIVALLGLLEGDMDANKEARCSACCGRLPCRRALRPAASIRNALEVAEARNLFSCRFR